MDIVTPRRVAFRTMPDFWPDEWGRSLKEIEQMDFDYVISGHGPENQPAIDPSTVAAEQRIYLEDLMAAVKAEFDKGTHNPDKLRQIVKLPKEPLINSESFSCVGKMRQIKAPIAGNSTAIAKVGNAELAYFNKQMLIHELIRGSLSTKTGNTTKSGCQ